MIKKQEKDDGIVDGFSSDEQVKHQQIIIEQRKKTEIEQVHHKEEVKFKIPPPQEIKEKSYSLHPDIATGWAPKNQLPVPIPMFFENRRVDSIVKRLLQKKFQKMKLCYLGQRFQNTFYAWYNRQFQFPYAHIKAPHNMKFTNRAFCGQHWDAQNGLIFDSFFQSGNLDCAIQVGEHQYDIYMRVDSNTRGHLQWFNFKVKNIQKLIKYKFNICNLMKNKSLYSRGQKPFIYSKKKFEKQKKGWEQLGQHIRFQQKPGKSAKILNSEFTSSYKLSFQYYTEYENDQIQIAYCIPYTYTQLNNFLKDLQNRPGAKNFLTTSKLCQSLGGLDIPIVTIHYGFSKQYQAQMIQNCNKNGEIPKKCIIISGRVHPGQSNGSHMMHGFLQFLCGQSKQAKLLRQNFIFKIVPMLNPDGVTLGNYRTGISGRDFNRQYRNPDKSIFPEVYTFKKFVIDNKNIYKQNLLMFLDFHGHSTKKNVFVYGPQFPIIQKHYYQCRVFPKLLGNHTNMFRYYSCSFKVSQFKETTARAIFLRRILIPLSYTIQASNGSFYDHQSLKDVPFNSQTWMKMGQKIGTALAQYGELIIASERFKIDKFQQRKAKKDIKIRKTSKGKSNQTPKSQRQALNNSERQIILLAGNENQKIKKIFDQIKKAQSQKQLQKNQQDQISQGSSDGQGQKDDLSPQKLNLLFQIIKNKKANIPQKYCKRLVEDDSKHYKTNQHQHDHQNEHQQPYINMSIIQNQPLVLDIKPIDLQRQLIIHQFPRQQAVFRPNTNIRGYLLRNRNNNTAYLPSDKKKQKVAARIINFSFIGHSSRALCFSNEHKRDLNAGGSIEGGSDLTLSGKLRDPQDAKIKAVGNSKVLDLSDATIFRQTFNGPTMRDQKATSNRSPDRKNFTFMNMSPRKITAAKLEDFKYKRLFIDDFKM